MSALNMATAASFQDYIRDFAPQLLSKAYVGFTSAQLFTPHEGVKGQLILTELTVADLARRYSSTFAPIANAIDFDPRTLLVKKAKVDLAIVPADFESAYLGMFRQKGQNFKDLPFEAFIMDKIMAKLQSEQEAAVWKGAAAGSPASTDKLIALFDGIREIIKDEITATNLTPVATGALTATNCVSAVETTHAALGDAYHDVTVDIFMNSKDKIKFVQDYRERYGKYYQAADGTVTLETGNAVFHFSAHVPTNCILITPKENIHYGYDGPMDDSMFNFIDAPRTIQMWMDFYMGVNFGIVSNDIIAVNNQWTV